VISSPQEVLITHYCLLTTAAHKQVVRVLSEHHWAEEWAAVTQQHALVLRRHKRQEMCLEKGDLLRAAIAGNTAVAMHYLYNLVVHSLL
jgi:hypothetical protein